MFAWPKELVLLPFSRYIYFSFLSGEVCSIVRLRRRYLEPRSRPFRDPSFVVSTPYYPLSVFLVISFYFLMAPCSWRGSPVLMNTADDVEIVGPCHVRSADRLFSSKSGIQSRATFGLADPTKWNVIRFLAAERFEVG